MNGIGLRMFPLGSQGTVQGTADQCGKYGAVFPRVECGGTVKDRQREISSEPKRKEVWTDVNIKLSGKLQS